MVPLFFLKKRLKCVLNGEISVARHKALKKVDVLPVTSCHIVFVFHFKNLRDHHLGKFMRLREVPYRIF
jgi:hypothetical protein